jgi:pimeloyl-ACP methyl ester carboxylesterase
MVPSAASLRAHYPELDIPVRILAGAGDLVVRPRQAERLHAAINGSELRIVPGVGHMIHHVSTAEIVEAVDDAASLASERAPAGESIGPAPDHHQEEGARQRAAAAG